VTYNHDSRHHAKNLTTIEALSETQPSKTIEDLYIIYEGAKEHNLSKAQLEIRVPSRSANHVLQVNEMEIQGRIFAFPQEDWWYVFSVIHFIWIDKMTGISS